jgi:hypothetical protein
LVGPSVRPSPRLNSAKSDYVENWLRHDCFEKRRRKRKSADVENWLHRNCFAPGNGCPFLFFKFPLFQIFSFFQIIFFKCFFFKLYFRNFVGVILDQADGVTIMWYPSMLCKYQRIFFIKSSGIEELSLPVQK